MNDFDDFDFHDELDPSRWTEETTLRTPTFEATLKEDGTLWIRGLARRVGFTVAAAQALARFLSERVQLPPVEPPYGCEDFHPMRVEDSTEYLNELGGHNQALARERAQEATMPGDAEAELLAQQQAPERQDDIALRVGGSSDWRPGEEG